MPASLPIHVFYRTGLIGGGAGDLDGIDGNYLAEGYRCDVEVSGIGYEYWLNASSGAATNSPLVIPPATNAGNKRWILKKEYITAGSSIVLGSDADGDMYYRASSILARLAKGAANTKLFMNAGATAPEWALGSNVISGTRDLTAASGDVAYTGVGFKPSVLIFIGADDSTALSTWGFHANGNMHQISQPREGNVNTFVSHSSSVMIFYYGAGASQSAIVKTLDADGFTLTWTKSGSPTGTGAFGVLALR